MLTVNFDRLPRDGRRLLDIGCGRGRHTFEAARRGMQVVSCDLDLDALEETTRMASAMRSAGELPPEGGASATVGNVLSLPFDDETFDVVIASEVLEHIEHDERALLEIARVLKPKGALAVTVPRWWPERICWALSSKYHDTAGGHVRIYRSTELMRRVRRAGFTIDGSHHAHALHSPYWWLKCGFGIGNEDARLPRLYHRFLVWDITRRPRFTRVLERILNPVMGKSLVVYARKTHFSRAVRRAA